MSRRIFNESQHDPEKIQIFIIIIYNPCTGVSNVLINLTCSIGSGSVCQVECAEARDYNAGWFVFVVDLLAAPQHTLLAVVQLCALTHVDVIFLFFIAVSQTSGV